MSAEIYEKVFALEAISPIDGRYHDKTKILSPYTSEYALIKTRIEVESKYLIALSDIGVVRDLNDEERDFLHNMSELSVEDALKVKEIESVTHHDVKSIEFYIKSYLKGTTLEDVSEMVHFGLTSEDVNNIAYRLMLKRGIENVTIPTLDSLVERMVETALEHKDIPMLGRTHGQAAEPTTLGKEIIIFASRLNKQVRRLGDQNLTGKLNSAVGNYNDLEFACGDVDWIKFSTDFVKSFGLTPNLFTNQINSSEDIFEILQTLQNINGVIVDFNQDMWRYISDEWMVQQVTEGQIGSSIMPQKVNPIDFEQSEGNVYVVNGFINGIVQNLKASRLQRDLSGSTVMRNLGSILAYSHLIHVGAEKGLGKVFPNQDAIKTALNNDWSILAGGAQTLLRKHGVDNPYTLLQDLTKGKKITEDEWKEWAYSLDVDIKVKSKIANMTPETHIGLAVKLTQMAIEEIKDSRKVKNG